MSEQEAIEILEEVKELDDSMYQFNPKYMEALETVLTITRNLHNFMRGLWEEHCVGDITYTSKEAYDMINKEVFEEGEQTDERDCNQD